MLGQRTAQKGLQFGAAGCPEFGIFIGPKSDHWLPLLKIGQYFAADAWFKVMQFNPIRTGLFDHI